MDAGDRNGIGDWIVRAALAGAGEIEILTGVCERLNDAGLSLVRPSVANNLLDPTFDARGVRCRQTSRHARRTSAQPPQR